MRLRSREGKVAHGLLAHVSSTSSPGRTRGAVTAFKRSCRSYVVLTYVSYTRAPSKRAFSVALGSLSTIFSATEVACVLCESTRSRCSCSKKPLLERTAMFHERPDRTSKLGPRKKIKEASYQFPLRHRHLFSSVFLFSKNTCTIYGLTVFEVCAREILPGEILRDFTLVGNN